LNALTYVLDDAHLAVSRAVADSVPPRLGAGLRVLHHGIVPGRVRDRLACREEVRAELGVGPDEVLAGTAANYRASKGYPNLLAAARRLVDEGLPVRFVAMGQGPLEGRIRAIHRELGLGDRFVLLGYQEDVPRVLSACDLFVMASVAEGLPLAMMEALAMGLPVVATAVGGVPEAITHGREGLLVPPSRPDLLAGALRELVADPERRACMGRAALARGSYFDIARPVRATEDLYRRLVGA
jgi:glycosyltransferase involved in cell wall biosynthesis